MTKKTKAPAPLPLVTLFVKVDHDTWTKLTVLAAQLGRARLSLYTYAITWAVNQEGFVKMMMNMKWGKSKKAKK